MKDQTESIEIVFFSSVIDKISNNNSYDLKKIRIQKFMNNYILKYTESTTVTENSNINSERKACSFYFKRSKKSHLHKK